MTTSAPRLYDPPPEVKPGPLPLLSVDPLPGTHWPYYSKKLVAYWLLDVPPWRVPSLMVGPAPIAVYRLTPAAFAWFWRAVENLAAKPEALEAARFAADVLGQMDAWLTGQGLAGEVRAARKREIRALPEPSPVYDDRPAPVKMAFNERRRHEGG